MSAADAKKAAEEIRKQTEERFGRVLATYGSAYANGWRTGRLRAADEIEAGANG